MENKYTEESKYEKTFLFLENKFNELAREHIPQMADEERPLDVYKGHARELLEPLAELCVDYKIPQENCTNNFVNKLKSGEYKDMVDFCLAIYDYIRREEERQFSFEKGTGIKICDINPGMAYNEQPDDDCTTLNR